MTVLGMPYSDALAKGPPARFSPALISGLCLPSLFFALLEFSFFMEYFLSVDPSPLTTVSVTGLPLSLERVSYFVYWLLVCLTLVFLPV